MRKSLLYGNKYPNFPAISKCNQQRRKCYRSSKGKCHHHVNANKNNLALNETITVSIYVQNINNHQVSGIEIE
jgi:hypothetical protein